MSAHEVDGSGEQAARRALIEYFTGNPDDEFDGPCSVVDAYAAAVRGEAKAPVYQIVTDSSGEHLVQIRCANCAEAEARIAELEAAVRAQR